MPGHDSGVSKFARRLLRLERDFKTFQVTPRLGNTSIDNGGAITINNPITGSPQVIIGNQGDGSNGVQQVGGETPPQPSVPTTSPALGFGYATWDGRYAGDTHDPITGASVLVPAPFDFARVEVHVGSDPDFVPDVDTTLQATIESPRGGTVGVGVAYDQARYVRLVVRSLSGKASPPSAAALVTSRRVNTPDIANYAVTSINVQEFALVVTKFHSLQHLIY